MSCYVCSHDDFANDIQFHSTNHDECGSHFTVVLIWYLVLVQGEELQEVEQKQQCTQFVVRHVLQVSVICLASVLRRVDGPCLRSALCLAVMLVLD